MFKELLDPIIEDRHGGYKPTDEHKTDLNPDNLQVRVARGEGPAGWGGVAQRSALHGPQGGTTWILTTRRARGCARVAASAASASPHCSRGERQPSRSSPSKGGCPLSWALFGPGPCRPVYQSPELSGQLICPSSRVSQRD